MHDNWLRIASGRRAAEVFMKTTEEHQVLRPIKRAKIHESPTVTEKGPSSSFVAWRARYQKFAMRQQRKDVGPKFKEAQRELRCYFSGVSQRRMEREFSAASGAHCTFFEQYHALKLLELITPTKQG